jgi:hypothetical protein
LLKGNPNDSAETKPEDFPHETPRGNQVQKSDGQEGVRDRYGKRGQTKSTANRTAERNKDSLGNPREQKQSQEIQLGLFFAKGEKGAVGET